MYLTGGIVYVYVYVWSAEVGVVGVYVVSLSIDRGEVRDEAGGCAMIDESLKVLRQTHSKDV